MCIRTLNLLAKRLQAGRYSIAPEFTCREHCIHLDSISARSFMGDMPYLNTDKYKEVNLLLFTSNVRPCLYVISVFVLP